MADNNRRVALLRAINVGGTGRLAMADLRAFASALGFSDPVTLGQSGNLMFGNATGADGALETKLEYEAGHRLGFRPDFMIRTPKEWAAIVAANPFAEEALIDAARVQIMFLKTKPGSAALSALNGANAGPERLELGGRELFLHYPIGAGRSKLTNALIEKKLGQRGTARNWNTVTKIATMMRAWTADGLIQSA